MFCLFKSLIVGVNDTRSNECITEVLQGLRTNLNSPYVRNVLLKQADIEYEAGNIANSVYYQTQALALGYRCKYYTNKIQDPLEAAYEPLKEINRNTVSPNPLFKFAYEHVKQPPPPPSTPTELTFQADPQKGIESIQDFCQSLPKEWTVVQLCKGFAANSSNSQKAKIITASKPIYLSILKNLQSDTYKEPICIKIDMTKLPAAENLYELIYKITTDLKDPRSRVTSEDSKEQKLVYNHRLESVETDIKEAIEKLRASFGPWRYFLSGPATAEFRNEEKQVYREVKLFSEENLLNAKQHVLLSTLARFRSQLSKEDVKMALPEITRQTRLANRIKKFLLEKDIDRATSPIKCFPCILIVDELLDNFFWETLNEQQELCRVSSLHSFRALYEKYAKDISDGYLRISVDQGSWVLNPDKTLDDMEKRISAFIDFWSPKMSHLHIDRNIPTADNMIKYLKESDIFLYSGHGSGLQYYSGHAIASLASKSVVFLLGCDSTRLKSEGWHSEMTGSHLYFFAAQCPAVIGTILIAFDRRLDTWSTNLLSTWIPTGNKNHWRSVDRTMWAKKLTINVKRSMNKGDLYEPRLCWIMCKLRESEGNYHSRVCYVYRGLPLWNTKAE